MNRENLMKGDPKFIEITHNLIWFFSIQPYIMSKIANQVAKGKFIRISFNWSIEKSILPLESFNLAYATSKTGTLKRIKEGFAFWYQICVEKYQWCVHRERRKRTIKLERWKQNKIVVSRFSRWTTTTVETQRTLLTTL